MLFSDSLVNGKLLRRYKRFLADVELASGEVVTAHCANPGSMMGLKEPGLEVWLSPVPKESNRKLRYTWEIARVADTLVGVNTGLPNKLVAEAIEQNKILALAGYQTIRSEVAYGSNSRVDFLLTAHNKSDCYLEVKNVHLRRGELAQFPDSVTKRGAKHLNELTNMLQAGHRAVIMYVVQRSDCRAFKLAADIDPDYAKAAKQAHDAGVERLCYSCNVTTEGINITTPVEVRV